MKSLISEYTKHCLQQAVLRQQGATNISSSAVLLSAMYPADRPQMSNRIYFHLL